MTKEELEKEAEKYVKQNYCEMCVLADDCKSGCVDCFTVRAYVASAEPREKQIQIDAEQIRALQKQNGELTDELKALRESVKDYGAKCYENGLRNGKRKLEQQIEKMKSCENCVFFKDKTYDICHNIKKLGTRKCAFYKMM